MKNILVAVDGSAPASRALAKACELAGRFGAKLTIINVLEAKPFTAALQRLAEGKLSGAAVAALRPLPVPVPSIPGIGSPDALETLDSQSLAVSRLVSERILGEAKMAAGKSGIAADVLSASGDVAHEILSAARELPADLVVIGRRGLSDVAELLMGSVSQKILHHSHTDVLTVS